MVAPLDQIFREEWGRVLATLIGFLGDFDLAEEAAQEAFAIAADRWPRDGLPSNPRAWLMTTARNRATDSVRRERTLAAKASLLAANCAERSMNATTFPDERLELIFTCCHPALALEAQVALTLRTLGGLTTREIARAFLVPERNHAALACRAALAMLDSQLTANIAERVHRGAMLLDERLALWSRLHLVCRAGGRLVRGVSLACTIQRCCWKEIRSESELNRVTADHLSLRWYLG